MLRAQKREALFSREMSLGVEGSARGHLQVRDDDVPRTKGGQLG